MTPLLLAFLALAPQGGDRAGVTVWDTVRPDARDGWVQVPAGEKPAAFKGDAVLSNGQVSLLVRAQGEGVDLRGAEGAPGARLSLLAEGGDGAARLDRIAVVENGRGAAAVEVAYRTAKGAVVSARFRLKRGDVSAEVDPGAGADSLRVDAPGRFAVLPDFFADDLLIDATRLKPAAVEVPSENFLIHLAGGGDALVMCVFENREQDVRIQLSGEKEKRVVAASAIRFGQKRKVWAALLEGKGIWHAADIGPADGGKILPLGWKMPFPAQWRVDFTRADELTDSWEMVLEEKDGRYYKPSWLGNDDRRLPPDRKRWIEILGEFAYPCWVDREGQGRLQPLQHKFATFAGPAALYPLGRVRETPADRFTALDVMRNTLGVGPCEYVLDLEGQKEKSQGNYTCHVRDRLGEIYGKGEQKARRDEIEKLLKDALDFVVFIRGRIETYLEFGREVRGYLADQKKVRPELAEFIGEMDRIAAQMGERLGDRRDRIKAPADVEALNDDFRRNVRGYEGPDVKERLQKYTDALTLIGGNQDKLVMECRWIVKALRQRAGLLMAAEPKAASVAEEIRTRTQKILRNPTVHEKARH